MQGKASCALWLALLIANGTGSPTSAGEAGWLHGWTAEAARDEIRPQFAVEAHGGPHGDGALAIACDQREGLAGHWKKSFDVVVIASRSRESFHQYRRHRPS